MSLAEHVAIPAIYVALLGSALLLGAAGGWPLAAAHLVVAVGVAAWLLGISSGRLRWRRTPLDLPLAALLAFVLLQALLGNRPLAAWALGPPAAPDPERFPAPFLALGSVSPGHTVRALLLFGVYAGILVLVVSLFARRERLVRLVGALVVSGGVLAFASLLDYMTGAAWFLTWRQTPAGGRLAGSFDNPDHFAAWLSMVSLLGLGWTATRHVEGRRAPPARLFFVSAGARERLLRRYAPLIAVAVMLVATVFTLSRGGLASLAGGLLVFVALLRARGGGRWVPAALGALLAVVATHAAWIGLDPLTARVPSTPGDFGRRWLQWQSTLPMLADFPLLGVGLGAYRDIYFRYQPLALEPGTVYYPYAHSDLLQLVVELGALGTLLALFVGWRIARHLLVPPRPGETGRAEPGRDAVAVGIGAGATGAVVALTLHSAVDFAARIPANGMLGAACLGIALVALGRSGSGARLAARAEERRAGRPRGARIAGAVAAVAVLAAAVALVVRDAAVAQLVRSAAGPARASALDRAVALDGGHTGARTVRAGLQLDAAAHLWRWGEYPGGSPVASLDEQRRAASALLDGAVADLRAVLARTPSDPFVHERLAWAYGLLSLVDAARGDARRAEALAHLERARLLAPDNPFVYRSRAMLGLTAPHALLPDALRAAREAVRREPRLLPELVERLRVVGVDTEQWRGLAGPSVLEQLELAAVLESRRLYTEARRIYEGALERAEGDERALLTWRLARLLVGQGEARQALRWLDALGNAGGDDPELHLVRADALALQAAPEAREAYERAVAAAAAGGARGTALAVPAAQAERLAAIGINVVPRFDPVRYRRALARHLLDRREWEAAVREWTVVTQLAPRDAEAHHARGIALERLARPSDALEAFQRAVAIDGRRARFRLALARRLWQADRYHEAAAEWKRASDLEPADAGIRLVLARAYLRLGQRAAAQREFSEAARLAPEHPEVRRGFAALDPLALPGS